MMLVCFSACKAQDASVATENVTIRIAGDMSEFKAIENMAAQFSKENPGYTVEYEYLQNYAESLPKRLTEDEDSIDLFITSNIQAESENLSFALELYSAGDALDLSETFPGLIKNFEYHGNTEKAEIYSLPLGAEIRGMFVNKTLLASLGLEVPENREELLNTCKVLLENGYTPLQGNPGKFAQTLLYPYICNGIANAENYDEIYNTVNKHETGVSEIFRDPMNLMYECMSNNYYNYKYIENKYNIFLDPSVDMYTRSFFNISEDDEKIDDLGIAAFMPAQMSMQNDMAKAKEDYHSEIDYEFILSPVGEDGGYAYMSPSEAIAVNKNSGKTDAAIKFLSYIMKAENNEKLCSDMGLIPNTENALEIMGEKFDVPADRMAQLGQVTFDYDFYEVINSTLVDISKGNNPKYMKEKSDGSYELYDFEHYMEGLESSFAELG